MMTRFMAEYTIPGRFLKWRLSGFLIKHEKEFNMKVKHTFAYGLFAVIFAIIVTACPNGNDPPAANQPVNITWTAIPFGTPTTTAINFAFNAVPTGLTASDITIAPGTGSARGGVLSGTGVMRTLTVYGVSAGTVAVSINRSGIASESQTVMLAAPSITGVTVSPANTSVGRGGTQGFAATVLGTGNHSQDVTWSIDQANRHAQTSITPDGVLSVATAEILTMLTVRATSTIDASRSGTASVTIRELSLVDELALLRVNAQSGGNYTITVNHDESLSPAQAALPTGRSNLTITLNGGGVARNLSIYPGGVLFDIPSGVTLVLGNNLTLRGRPGFSNNSHLVRVNSGGNLVMNAGSRITGNINHWVDGENRGGGVRVLGGTFTMNGGEISGNFDRMDSGGVLVADGGTFNMHGGTISGNTTGDSAGGVGVSRTFDMLGGTFNMHGGTITGNRAGGNFGGGVVVGRNGTFTMHNGTISDNDIANFGGGVSVLGMFTMHDGTITGNATTGFSGGGGGVHIDGGATFDMRGGTISGNAANGGRGGGGVLVSHAVISGTFRISNGTIYGSDAAEGLRNTSAGGLGHSGALSNEGIAQYGTFSGVTFNRIGNLMTTNDTIRVVNGVWQITHLRLSVENRSQWLGELINVQLFRRGEPTAIHSMDIPHISHHTFPNVPVDYYRVLVAVAGYTLNYPHHLAGYAFLSGNVNLRLDGNWVLRAP